MTIRALPKWQNDASGETCGRFHSAITQTHPNHITGLPSSLGWYGTDLFPLLIGTNWRGAGILCHPRIFSYHAQTGTYFIDALHGLAVQALAKSAHFHSLVLSKLAAFDVSEGIEQKEQARCLIPTKRLPR